MLKLGAQDNKNISKLVAALLLAMLKPEDLVLGQKAKTEII